ncbi:hypothetical protein BDV93DRAFT_545942 [Ceratobasidium sp. AG-I]|nr:hypothetical protein BDV93DRAFT_545942 [Ceratobasidium sp. AG-I]
MADFRMRRVKLPIEVIAMVLSELTHAEAWRLRILNSAVNDWVLNVLVKRALQSTALVARAPGSFIFYEPPNSVHGLRFSFLQKHGAFAIFQAQSKDQRELVEDFKKKSLLQIVVHSDNNADPLVVRHLKVRDLSLDRDSVTMQCNWRNLFVSIFNMSLQQRSDQALATSPLYVWQPGKVDGMPGKWKKGMKWLYTESQVSSASQRSSSTTSSSQHLYGLVAYDSASATTTSSSSQASAQHTHSQFSTTSAHLNFTGTSNASSSLFSSSQLSQIGDVPQSSPPRHDARFGLGMREELSMLHSISAYPDSSCSSGPSRPPEVEGGSGSSVLKTLGLDGTKLNPAPDVDPAPAGDEREVVVERYTAYAFSPGVEEGGRSPLPVASSPMSESVSLAQSATIRPVLRGGGSSPLGVLEEEAWSEEGKAEEGDEGEGGGEGDMSYMLASERDVSCMLFAEDSGDFAGADQDAEEVEGEEGEYEYEYGELRGLARTESKSSGPESQGTTLGGTEALSRTHSGMTDTTDVEVVVGSVDEKERVLRAKLGDDAIELEEAAEIGVETRVRLGVEAEGRTGVGSPALGGVMSLPLAPRVAVVDDVLQRFSMSPEVRRVRREDLVVSADVVPPEDEEEEL